MAKCPFAVWDEINGSGSGYVGGPFKIVHHTTEGETLEGARAAYAANNSDPHFTVDATTIHQHIDTGVSARSLRNEPGGVETNRDSAVQIEVVAYAGRPKNPKTLANVAELCRWIESVHGVPQTWPNGPPRYSTNGHDPGNHNRSSANWDSQAGHYGHSQVPENTHWDPGYTPAELSVVTPNAMPMTLDLHAEFATKYAHVSPVELREATANLTQALMATFERIGSVAQKSRLFPTGVRVIRFAVKTAPVQMEVVIEGATQHEATGRWAPQPGKSSGRPRRPRNSAR